MSFGFRDILLAINESPQKPWIMKLIELRKIFENHPAWKNNIEETLRNIRKAN
jgi:hypothetical protein